MPELYYNNDNNNFLGFGVTNFDEIWINDSSYNKGTNSLVTSESMPMGVTKITMAGTYRIGGAGFLSPFYIVRTKHAEFNNY